MALFGGLSSLFSSFFCVSVIYIYIIHRQPILKKKLDVARFQLMLGDQLVAVLIMILKMMIPGARSPRFEIHFYVVPVFLKRSSKRTRCHVMLSTLRANITPASSHITDECHFAVFCFTSHFTVQFICQLPISLFYIFILRHSDGGNHVMMSLSSLKRFYFEGDFQNIHEVCQARMTRNMMVAAMMMLPS